MVGPCMVEAALYVIKVGLLLSLKQIGPCMVEAALYVIKVGLPLFLKQFGLHTCMGNTWDEIGLLGTGEKFQEIGLSLSMGNVMKVLGLLGCTVQYLETIGLCTGMAPQNRDFLLVDLDAFLIFRVMVWGEVDVEMVNGRGDLMYPGRKT